MSQSQQRRGPASTLVLLWYVLCCISAVQGFTIAVPPSILQQTYVFTTRLQAVESKDTPPQSKMMDSSTVDAFVEINATEVVEIDAPPLSFQKFLTMQGKRVIVTIRYSGGESAGLKPYFLTAAKKIKASHPDVILERRQTASLDPEDPTDEPSFEILVDGKVIVGNNKSRSRKKIDNVQKSIFVSMQELDLVSRANCGAYTRTSISTVLFLISYFFHTQAISRARRRRRPSTTVYGEVHEPGSTSSPLGSAASDMRRDGLKKDPQPWND